MCRAEAWSAARTGVPPSAMQNFKISQASSACAASSRAIARSVWAMPLSAASRAERVSCWAAIPSPPQPSSSSLRRGARAALGASRRVARSVRAGCTRHVRRRDARRVRASVGLYCSQRQAQLQDGRVPIERARGHWKSCGSGRRRAGAQLVAAGACSTPTSERERAHARAAPAQSAMCE